jgi:23S rRNA (cytosine1962-C5)-methyltransferase
MRGDVVKGVAEPGEEVEVADERGKLLGAALFAAAPAPIALRIFSRDPAARLDDLLGPRLEAAVGRRKDALGDWRAARLVHAEADLLPGLVVDRWGDACAIQTGTAGMDRRVNAIAAKIAALTGARLVVRRDDGSARDHEGLPRTKGVLLGGGPSLLQVEIDGTVRELDVLADRKTGGFLDQRANHRRAAELARGGEAIDAFTHHGGFGLALARRSRRVICIDQDPAAAARARRNAELSHLSNVEVEVADAFARLRELERTNRRFQVVCVDPPALAKQRGGVEGALRAYHELNLRAIRICEPGGHVVTCSCSGRVTAQAFGEMLAGAAGDAGRPVVVIERRGAGPDHPMLLGVPETEYLKCWILQVL